MGREFSFKRSRKAIVSSVALAAFLPVLIWLVQTASGVRFTSRAADEQVLRVWFEPASVAASPGQSFFLEVMVEYGSDGTVPEASLRVIGNESVEVLSEVVEFKRPFVGRVSLGLVEVKAVQVGKGEVRVVAGSVYTQMPNLEIESVPALIDVR